MVKSKFSAREAQYAFEQVCLPFLATCKIDLTDIGDPRLLFEVDALMHKRMKTKLYWPKVTRYKEM